MNTSYSRRAILIGVIVALLALTLLGVDVWRSYQRSLREAGKVTRNLTVALEAHTRHTIQSVDLTLFALAARPESLVAIKGGATPMQGLMQAQLASLPQATWITLFNRVGQPIVSTDPAVVARLDNVADRDYFRAAKESGSGKGAFISPPVRGRASGRWLFVMSRRVNDGRGEFAGIMAAAVEPNFFPMLYRNIEIGPNGNVTLFHENGLIVARSPAHDEFAGRSAANGVLFREHLPKADAGTARLKTVLQDREILYSYSRVQGTPLVINVALDMNDVLADWRQSLVVYAVLALGILLLVVFAVVMVLRGHRQAERERDEAESSFRALFEHASEGILLGEAGTGRIRSCNPAMCRLLGYTESELLQLSVHDIRPADQRAVVREKVSAMLGQSGSGTLSAVPTLRKDGSVILADMSSFRVQIGGRNFVAGLFRDVTDMHAAQEARRASEERLNEAQRIARVGNWELDLISGRLAWSNEIFRIFEIDREKFGATYDAFLNAIHPEDRAAVDKAYSDSLLTRQPYDIVHRLLMSDGRIKYVHEHCESTFDAEGKPVLSVGTIQDVTERKLAENQLAESYRLLEAIVDTVPVRIFWKDRNSRFLGGNAAFAADAGLTQAAELIGKDDYQFPWKDQAEIYRADDRKVMAEGIAKLSYEEPHTSRGGGAAWLRTSKVPLRDVHGDIIGVLGVYDDITERRNTEQELLNLNSRLQATLQAIPDVLFELDVEGRYHEVWARNPALLAAERDRLLGHTVTKLLPPEAAGVVLQALRNAAEHGFSQGEQIRLSLADGEHWFELSTARKNGNPGDPLRFVMLSRDFTDRKHAEQLVLRLNVELEQRVALRTEELLKANRELETFSYSVAHDLRAPLRGIDGYSRLLLTDHVAQLDDEGRTFLNNIVRATQHMNEVIEDLLVYSRLERREMQIGPIDLQALSESVLAERAGEIKARGVAVRVAVDCRSALADREGLTMALRNLLENALKFSRDVSQPAIEITGRDSGSACILSVRDNGVGFDMKFHDRIFEIFQRLHRSEDYPGTGVGLAIVRKAMERMNGRVWAESTPGKGATFHLEIPE